MDFSGNGSKNLGTIDVPKDSTLSWTNDGMFFGLMDKSFDLTLDSEAPSGDTRVEAGTYRKVEVTAEGDWTIKIRPT